MLAVDMSCFALACQVHWPMPCSYTTSSSKMARMAKMATSRDDGRAMPPRPSLLAGDAAACHVAAAKLSAQASALFAALPADRSTSELQLLEQTMKWTASGQMAATESSETLLQRIIHGLFKGKLQAQLKQHRHTIEQLGLLVNPLRFLRESLVSNDMLSTSTACQVYELSCDVAAAAGREAAPELFKALQGLINEVYPSLQTASTASESSAATQLQQPGDRCVPRSTVDSTTDCEQAPKQVAARQGEITAAYLLFFAVAPSFPPRGELVNVLRSSPVTARWHHPAIQWTVKVLAACSHGNWLTVLKLRDSAPASPTSSQQERRPMLLRQLLDFQLTKLRQATLAMCGSSYRTLPWSCAQHLLGLHDIPASHAGLSQASTTKVGLLLRAPADAAWDKGTDGQERTEADLHAVPLAHLYGTLQAGVLAGNRAAVVALNHMQQLAAASCSQTGTQLVDLVFKA